jgi:hypothetical protein
MDEFAQIRAFSSTPTPSSRTPRQLPSQALRDATTIRFESEEAAAFEFAFRPGGPVMSEGYCGSHADKCRPIDARRNVEFCR